MPGAVINTPQRWPQFRNLMQIKRLDSCLVPITTPECQLVLLVVLAITTRGEDSPVSPRRNSSLEGHLPAVT